MEPDATPAVPTVITVAQGDELFEFQISEEIEEHTEIEIEDHISDIVKVEPIETPTKKRAIPTRKAKKTRQESAPSANDGDDEVPVFMDDKSLKNSIAKLLDIVMDEETLNKFGWPDAPVDTVLSAVIEGCGQTPADYDTCWDEETKLRENVKVLLTTVLDNDDIKLMLNNYTVDEVIKYVLNLTKS